MITPTDETLLRRALRVAMNGRGRVEPNPMVGCVLARNGRVIAEGHHGHFGGPHAEPAALADCQSRGHDARDATAYVTLEPCCHTNKKTPPCAPRLIEAGIARVVIGCLDPNPDVDGRGVALLRAAGIAVDLAPPESAALFLQLIAPFRTPPFYTTVKWAESADGYVAGVGGMPIRITSAAANQAVHRLRTRSDAIAVGIGTVLSDDPLLTVRGVEIVRRPTRIVLDRGFRMPLDARLLADTRIAPVVLITDADQLLPGEMLQEAETSDVFANGKVRSAFRIRELGGRLIAIDTEALSVARMIEAANVVPAGGHLMIEAGPHLARAALPATDRLWRFVSSDRLQADESAPRAATVPAAYVETGRITLGPDTLIEYLNRDAASFVTATPSADFVLEAEHAAASA
jgi:diaminohydroxyphosphoribosylaminopyrimidine deaminase/5-amino-6-(5-phosphoribosylamino)uracil reductase